MKLNLPRKVVVKKDQRIKEKVNKRLTVLSERTRRKELAGQPPPGNLTLNSVQPVAARPAVKVTIKTSRPVHSELAVAETREKKIVRKARSFFGRHLPVLACSNCSLSRVCPKFRAGYECAFLPFLHSHKVETAHDLVTYMKDFVGNSMRRAQLMNIIETANGGMPSVETSEALDMAFKQLKDLHTVMSERTEDDISLEGDESVIGAIFGGLKPTKILEDTREMKRVDPIIDLPKVEGTELPPVLNVSDDIASELVRDAILGQGSGKKDLKSDKSEVIEQGSLTTA